MKIKLKNVRLSFPQLFVPKGIRQKDGTMSEPKYTCSLLFPPGSPQHKIISDACREAAKEKWPSAYEVHLKAMKATDKLCLHDGDLKTSQGYPGNLYVNASSKDQPDLRDANAARLGPNNAKKLYGGCYVDAILSIWGQDNQFGKRINAEIIGIQFRADGDAFRPGEVATDDDFEDLSDNGEDESVGAGAGLL